MNAPLTTAQRAMIAARIHRGDRTDFPGAEKASPTRDEAAALLGVSICSVTRGRIVLDHGTPEEIAAVENGSLALKRAVILINCRNTSINGKRKHPARTGMSERGKNPERIAKMRKDGVIWKELRTALLALTALPRPSDVAGMVKAHDRSGLVKSKLANALTWLEEFSKCHQD